jgi:hypothetical protein
MTGALLRIEGLPAGAAVEIQQKFKSVGLRLLITNDLQVFFFASSVGSEILHPGFAKGDSPVKWLPPVIESRCQASLPSSTCREVEGDEAS